MTGGKVARWPALAVILLVIGASLVPVSRTLATPQPQVPYPYPEGERRYFSQTEHWVEGPFLDFYETRGGVRIFGYPQSRLFYDARAGLWVQYFDNVRMEWHPHNDESYQVQLSLLGEMLGHSQPGLPRSRWPSNNRFRRVFEQTGHVVSFAFLDFFDNYGGLDIFGYPISEPLLEGDYTVQYFQRARMAWHPERPREERVVLGALGIEYMNQFGVPDEIRTPPRDDFAIGGGQAGDERSLAPSLRIWAAVRHAVTGRDGSQTVFVYVSDERRLPVEGANVWITVRYLGWTDTLILPQTDGRGITEITFPVGSPPPGRTVVIHVNVVYQGTTGSAQTSFLPWW